MSWVALELEIEGAAAEPFSEALLELGADSVTIENASSDAEHAGLDDGAPGWGRNRIRAIVAPTMDAARFVRSAAAQAGLASAPRFEVQPVEPEDWVRRTQSQFGPLQIGERLWIVPSWAQPPANSQAIVLRLDPGLAFGTGSHPTTRLVLEWLERQYIPLATGQVPGSVLDYGCGSGILALAAGKLGALHIVATDNDPQALRTCAENAASNRVQVDVLAPEDIGARQFDLLVANILARPLVELAPTLARFAQRGAQLALSGILEEQAAEVIGAYADWFDVSVAATAEGWALVAGARR
jgi:ribosomal protein L11 methyltransferase